MSRREAVLKFWPATTPHIKTMLLNNEGVNIDLHERAEIFQMLPPVQNQSVLDLASGIGRFTGEFAKSAKKVVSVDLCSHFIEANKLANGHFSNIEWLCMDALDVEFAPQQFDLIFISWLFMYLDNEEIELLAKRLKGWLKPNGTLFLRESCAATTHFSRIEGYYANYRSMKDYDLLLNGWNVIKRGNIDAYERLMADPFNCYWICQNAIS